MRSIALYNRQGQRLLTLSEAEEKGYGPTDTFRQHLHRGKLRGYKIGPVWLILEASLSRPTNPRRALRKRSKK